MGSESLSSVEKRVDHLVFSQPTEDKAAKALEELLDAKIIVRGTERTAGGSPIYVERPDSPIILTAAVKILEWNKGKPRQSLDVNTTPPGSSAQAAQSLARLMNENPELVLRIAHALAESAKARLAIDITATSSVSPAQPPESQSGASPS